MIYTIYEVPGVKIGATINWKTRSKWNFNKYNIEPVIVETLEGPNEPEFWQVVGDREWELADTRGYIRGAHYIDIRRKGSKYNFTNESRLAFNTETARHARSKWAFTDEIKDKIRKTNKARGAVGASIVMRICMHCGAENNALNNGKYHGDKCKHKKTLTN
jgi:hypothetical protein